MIYQFQSEVASDLLMLVDNAKVLLQAMNKDTEARTGIITAAQIPAALQGIQALITKAQEEANRQKKATPKDAWADDEREENEAHRKIDTVSVAARAQPLIAMLTRSQKAAKPVTWEIKG